LSDFCLYRLYCRFHLNTLNKDQLLSWVFQTQWETEQCFPPNRIISFLENYN
jgi:hypothetical protein